MPKRINNIYPRIYDIENLREAHRRAKKDKSFYRAVRKVEENLDEHLYTIQDLLKNKTYKVGMYRTQRKNDKGKQRILYKLPYYPDRIIQWAIMLQLEQHFNKWFCRSVCASLPKRGIHYASQRVRVYLNRHTKNVPYYVKIDVKKFYPSINRRILKRMLRRKIKDQDLLWLLDLIIDSFDNNDIEKLHLTEEERAIYCRPGIGLPIGSYLSQYLANFYLHEFDHWLFEQAHVHYMIRYMDDILILHNSKSFLRNLLCSIKIYLHEKLDLCIKLNYNINRTKEGVDIVGFRHFTGYVLIRKKLMRRIKHDLIYLAQKPVFSLHNWCSLMARVGQLAWANTNHFAIKYLKPLCERANTYYKKYIQKTKKKNFLVQSIFWYKYKEVRAYA